MAQSLRELRFLQKALGDVPILCAGDVFDKWNSPAELINFAKDYIPQMYCIPGQHDIPHHNYSMMNKSAYTALLNTNAIHPHSEFAGQPFEVEWFPWEADEPARECEFEGISVIHRYAWEANACHIRSTMDSNAKSLSKVYDSRLVVSGDNHKPFYNKSLNFFNCGGFYRRNSDQAEHKPRVGIVYRNYKVIPYQLDTSEDKHIPTEMASELEYIQSQANDWITNLRRLSNNSTDYRLAVETAMRQNGVLKEIRNYLLGVIDDEV